MFFLGRNFVSGLLCALKPKNLLKKLQKNLGFQGRKPINYQCFDSDSLIKKGIQREQNTATALPNGSVQSKAAITVKMDQLNKIKHVCVQLAVSAVV